LKSAQTPSSTRATATFVVPQTGWYHIDATSTVDNRGGDFTIKVECGRSGCLFPYLASDVSNVVIAYGQPATIALDLFAVGQTEARLIQDATRVATSATSQITTPPITQTKAYYVEVENACGSWLSNDFVISPDRTPRRRSVRK
ncbi:MAG TPA: hypothetical protein VJZ00_09885, partial [Thermoanaerobaculia bacterium]|nr:hypothetical protein [Thermoanaerobaculia bacterium]